MPVSGTVASEEERKPGDFLHQSIMDEVYKEQDKQNDNKWIYERLDRLESAFKKLCHVVADAIEENKKWRESISGDKEPGKTETPQS